MKCSALNTSFKSLRLPILTLIALAGMLIQTQCLKPDADSTTGVTIQERGSDDGITNNYEYFLDGKPVDMIEVEEGVDNWIVGIEYLNEDANDVVLRVYKFTNREDFIQFGSDNGINLELRMAVSAHLHHLADSSGVIAEYEATGKVPDWYQQYAQEYIISQQYQGAPVDRAVFALYRGCSHDNSLVGLNTYPALPSNFNNQVSGVEPFALLTLCSLFDKAFYSQHMMTWVNIGPFMRCLSNTPFNDKTSSCTLF